MRKSDPEKNETPVILDLALYPGWYDQIKNGQVHEDYRPFSARWMGALHNKRYTHITYKKSFHENEKFTIELLSIERGKAPADHPFPEGVDVYVLKLGSIVGE